LLGLWRACLYETRKNIALNCQLTKSYFNQLLAKLAFQN